MCSPAGRRMFGLEKTPKANVDTGSIMLGLSSRGMNPVLGGTVYDAGTSGTAGRRIASATPGS